MKIREIRSVETGIQSLDWVLSAQTTYGMHELKAEAFGLPLVFVFIIHSD
jgi:hypothetical protein